MKEPCANYEVQETPPPCCRSCGSCQVKEFAYGLSMKTPDPYPLSGSDMKVIYCHECEFVGNYTKSTSEAYSDYYRNFNKHQVREGDLRILDEQYFRKLIEQIKNINPDAFEHAKVLDFGSGARLFAELAIKEGAWQVENFDFTTIPEDITFDLIISTHCFEHILDFREQLAFLHSILSQEGLILISVPDISGYYDYYYGPYTCFDLEHINHFSSNSLTNALTSTGFSVIETIESSRRVTPHLTYPEVIAISSRCLDRKQTVSRIVRSPSAERSVRRTLVDYLDRSKYDLNATLDFALTSYNSKIIPGSKLPLVGIYGLSSHAFRLIPRMAEIGIQFSWFADSDERLRGKTIKAINIFSYTDFVRFVNENADKNPIVCFIAAVNASRINQFLTERALPIEIILLPPQCENNLE